MEEHTGVYGNQVADSLAKKGANWSESDRLTSPNTPKFRWWDADQHLKTVE